MINAIVDITIIVMAITIMAITIMAIIMVMDDRCVDLNNCRRRTATF